MSNQFKIIGFAIVVGITFSFIFTGCDASHDFVDKIKEKSEKSQHAMKSMNLYERAKQSYLSGNLKQAKQLINDSISCKGDVADAMILRLQIAIDMNDNKDVMNAIEEGEKIAPKDSRFPYYTGIYHERIGQTGEALICYKEAVKRDPSSVQYKLATAEMMIEENKLQEAARYLRRAIKYHPNSPGLLQTLGALMQIEGNDKRAGIYFSEALALAPTAKPIMENMAKSCVATGQYFKALQYLEYLINEPTLQNRRDLQTLAVKCYLKCNRPVEARQLLNKLTATPGFSTYGQLRLMADAAVMLADWGLLNSAASKMIDINENAMPGYVAMAIYFEQIGNKKSALEILAKGKEKSGATLSQTVISYKKKLEKNNPNK